MRRALTLMAASGLAAALLAASTTVPATAADESEPGPWEEVIFLPESGLAVLLERDPRGVLLDRGAYLDLHRQAVAARGDSRSDAKGPGARLLRCDVEGGVEGDQANLRVSLAIDSSGSGRKRLRLNMGGSVVGATLDGQPATIGSDQKGNLELTVAGDGLHEAVVHLVAPVKREKGTRRLDIAMPAPPATRWRFEIPGRVTASAADGLWRSERLATPDRTRLVTFGWKKRLHATWREGDQGTDLPPLVRGTIRTLAEVGERALDAAVLVRVECLRTPLDSFRVDLPSSLDVLGVDGDGASLLPATGAADGRSAYDLRFAEPFTGVRTVLLRTSRPLTGPGAAALPVADLPTARSVDRMLAVRFTDGLRGFVEPGEGAVRIDPAQSKEGAVDALLRVTAAATPSARSERPSVRLRADARVLLDLADDGPWLAASFLYLPRGDRLYGVDPLLPEGFLPETVSVSGNRSFLRGTTPDGRLSLVFPGGVEAGSAVTVTLRGRWPVAGWGDEDAAERSAPLPRLDAGSGAETGLETSGWLGVAVPPGNEIREEETTGLVPAAVSELRARAGFTSENLALGWRFRGSAPGGRLSVTRPDAAVTANVALLATPAEDHVSLRGSVSLSVQRSGIREVRLRVTPALGELLRIEGADIAERRRVDTDGGEVWIIRFARQVRDGTLLALSAELPLAEQSAAVPAIDIDGATQQELLVGVAAGGELEVTTTASGLREADPADLTPVLGTVPGGLLRAWKGEREGTPTLTVRTERLPPAPLPAAFADSVTLTTMLGMDGVARTRLLARVRNADRQALEVTLPAGALLSSARVDNKPVRPVQTAGGALLVPIVPSTEPFDLVLVYEQAVSAEATEASLLSPDLGIPGSRADWTVHLPEGSLPVETRGDFAAPPQRPGVPLCVRLVGGLLRGLGSMTMVEMRAPEEAPSASVAMEDAGYGAVAGPAERKARRPRAPPAPGEEMESADADVSDDAPAANEPMPALDEEVALEKSMHRQSKDKKRERAGKDIAHAMARMESRAAQRGLFGMDIQLFAAGPAVTATRLAPSGLFELSWRTKTGRMTGAMLAGLIAFLIALAARRAGVGAFMWTVVVLGALTAGPYAFAVIDPIAWDGAALGTLAYGVLALLATVYHKLPSWPRRWRRGGAAAASVALSVALVLVLAGAADADDRKQPVSAPPVSAPPADRVYVPYDPERPSSLDTPERVFLPYARYRQLWNDAHPEDRIDAQLPPVLISATYTGHVLERALILTARYEVDPSDGGVVALPPGAAVSELTVDGSPASATTAAPGGAMLVHVPASSAADARVVIEATLRWPLAGVAPGGALTAPIPRAPVCTLSLRLPLTDPVIALKTSGGHTTEQVHGTTEISAAMGRMGVLDIAWQPRGADAAGGRTRFEVESEAAVVLRTDRMEWGADIVLRVLAGTVREIDAEIPRALDVLWVKGPAVASWTVVEAAGDRPRALRVRLLGVEAAETRISLGALQRLDVSSDTAPDLVIPDLALSGAASSRHRVALQALSGRLAVVERVGMERTDLGGQAVEGTQAFRRVRSPARLVVRVEPHPTELTTTTRQHLHLAADASLLRAEFDISPDRAGLFEALIALPDGWALEDAVGATSFPEDGAVRLVFPTAPRATRRVTLRLRGPAAADAPLAFPVLRVPGATRETAELLVSTAPGFAAAAASAQGLEPVPADRFAGWPALDLAETRSLAWRDARGGGSATIQRTEMRATVRPTVVADLTVLDDRVIVDALMHWDVRGGLERVFQVDGPIGVTDLWVLGDGLREVRREAVDGRERLTITLQAAATGSSQFRVLYDLPVPPNGQVTVTGPEPVGVEGARAFLLLRALGEAEVQLGALGALEPCDLVDLPLIPDGLDPLRVLRFLRSADAGWSLPLTLATHEFGDLPEARIHLVDATTVADRDGSTRTRLLARLFNRARSFLPVNLGAGTDLEAVLVNDVPVRPVRRASEPGIVQVPIRVQSLGEESQVVALTFRTAPVTPGERFDTLEPRLPEFPGVPVDATTWRLLLPADRDYSFDGNLDPIEEAEVAIARAEAYASDVSRLRRVLSSGNSRQQAAAAENLTLNTAQMQQSLDVARTRLGELAVAAQDGRIDQERLLATQRKADDLTREIEEAMRAVRSTVPTATAFLRTEQLELQKHAASVERGRFATKEGQALKRWGFNRAPGDQAPENRQQQARAGQLLDALQQQSDAKIQQDADKALAAHEGFDNAVALRSKPRGYLGPAGEIPPTSRSAKPQTGGGQVIGIGGGAGGGAGGAFPARGRRRADRRSRDASAPSGGLLGQTDYQYGAGGGAGSGHAPVRYAQPVQGVISLAPELIPRGRAYAFRKLEAGAEITVSTRPQDVGERIMAVGTFLALVSGLWLVRRWWSRFWARRRARRTGAS